MDERQVIAGFHFPANQKRAKPIMPAIGALDDPAPRLAMNPPQERRLAAMPNVRHGSAMAHRSLAIGIIVRLVETTVLRPPHAAALAQHRRIERRREQPLVVRVRSAQHHTQRDPASIGEDMPFGAALRPVRWVRSREIPPFGAFTITESSAPHRH